MVKHKGKCLSFLLVGFEDAKKTTGHLIYDLSR